MRQHGMQGVWRGKGKITTKSRDDQQRADDLGCVDNYRKRIIVAAK